MPLTTLARPELALALTVVPTLPAAAQTLLQWSEDFPRTNFAARSIDLGEVVTYGRKDSIPPIDDPQFMPVGQATDIGDFEPLVSIGINDDFRAYPLRVLLFHEIVNDMVGGVPVVVSYCAFCNSGIVFDRRLDGEVLEFGNTGTYRHFGMVLYDKSTESWWQQFIGEAVVGDHLGKRLQAVPARLESLEKFRERAPGGLVLVPNKPDSGRYGLTPYGGFDAVPVAVARDRFPYELPATVNPMDRVVVVGDEAWMLELLQRRGVIEIDDLRLTWEAGQNSVHDVRVIAEGRDVGNVVVQRRTDAGWQDVRYEVSFAFTFAAFVPDGTLHLE